MSVSVFPNPSNGKYTIETTQPARVSVIYYTGSTVIPERPVSENRCSLDLSGLPTGVYIAKFSNNNGVVYKKLVKISGSN